MKSLARIAVALLLLSICPLLPAGQPAFSTGKFGPTSWSEWAARPALKPDCDVDKAATRWIVLGNGKPGRHGGWELEWPRVKPRQWYRFEVDCDAWKIASVHDNAHVELNFWKDDSKRSNWHHVEFQRSSSGLVRFSCLAQAPEDTQKVTARLMLRWTDKGRLSWTNPKLIPVDAPPERKIKAAIITGKPPGTSVAANMAFTLKLIREAAKAGAQVICLPEVITSWRIKDAEKETARPIPGTETRQLEAIARELNVDVALSMSEIDKDGLIYNTALYLDAKQGIIGKYRKVHLAVGERWRGITPGVEFPVWETGYGKAGMLVCYDNVHAEGHRILSQKGAEVIYLPIMGDPRAVGDRAYEKWLQIMSVRAMDNHVWMVVCQNNGDRGVIVRPDGEIITKVDPGNGFAMTEIDLNFRYKSWIGSDFRNRNWGERRPHLYGELIKDR